MILITITNYFNEIESLKINSKRCEKYRLSGREIYADIAAHQLNGQDVYFFLQELFIYRNYRTALFRLLRSRNIKHLAIRIVQPDREAIDYKWSEILRHTMWEKIETDYLMSWLSTLGGGFSALGDTIKECAVIAGKISIKQLEIGLRLGDPFLQARCWLFFSLSLIQRGRLRLAKHLVRKQYQFAVLHKETDSRLPKMCQGVWLKLQYHYIVKNENKTKSIKKLVDSRKNFRSFDC